MTRYIKEGELRERLCFDVEMHIDNDGVFWQRCADILSKIEQTQSVDIVECMKCKYWGDGKNISKCCVRKEGHVIPTEHDFWCKYGERGISDDE